MASEEAAASDRETQEEVAATPADTTAERPTEVRETPPAKESDGDNAEEPATDIQDAEEVPDAARDQRSTEERGVPEDSSVPCTACGTTGECSRCGGKGRRFLVKCGRCHGDGRCSVCGGPGYVWSSKT
jgi:hypothetical protein